MSGYVVGVDGGNTKTDYFLFDLSGRRVDAIRSGTCSHEALKDGFAGSRRVLGEELNGLLSRNNLAIGDVAAACFGLAGVDVPEQQQALEEIVQEIGFRKFVVVNDGFLGIKAGTRGGTGACSINGTATVSVGVDRHGNWMQVGGIGFVSGDEAGGAYLARRVVQAAYNETFRFGPKTSLTGALFGLFEMSDKRELSNRIVERFVGGRIDLADLVKLLFAQANDGDEVAISILAAAGEAMARSVAGCIRTLDFDDSVEIVLAGSVWAKAGSPHMFDAFRAWVEKLAEIEGKYVVLTVPPATGAIVWALELASGALPDDALRETIVEEVRDCQARLERTRQRGDWDR
jgi:N-acetylglucosamine kinase-like BadF-type ATPase